MKITIEKVEKLMDRADVGYEVAREALEVADGDILEAIITLEKEGKFGPNAGHSKPASYSTRVGADPNAVGENYGHTMLPQTTVSPNFTFAGDPGNAKKSRKTRKTKQAGNTGNEYANQGYGNQGYYNQGSGQHGYRYKDESSAFEDNIKKFGRFMGRLIRGGVVNYFEVWRKGERILYFPVILFLFCIIHWVFWLALAMIILGLICGCRYRFSGPHLGRKEVNDAMDKAAEFAEDLKDGEDPDNRG